MTSPTLQPVTLPPLPPSECPAGEIPINCRRARKSPAWITDGVIYQIMPRAFTKEGTLKAARARLPKLAELGVTVIYLCPVCLADDDTDINGWSPRQKLSGMNNPRNPYRPKDYLHVDPEYGTDADLKAFVKTAHDLGLRVLLDVVFLHCGPNAVFLKDHPDFVKRNEQGEIIPAPWGFPALNLANAALRDDLIDSMAHCIHAYDVDGFRMDCADQLPLDFWEEARRRMERLRPDVVFFAEGLRKENDLYAFDLGYAWADPYTAMDNAATLREHWEFVHRSHPVGGARFARFIDNHDYANDDYENRVEKRWGAAKVEAALTIFFTLDGVPFLYNGQEVADIARHSIFGNLPIDWANGRTAAGKARFAFCQRLCALRRQEPALTRGAVTWLETSAPASILAFKRQIKNQSIVTLANMTDKAIRVEVELGRGAGSPLLASGVAGDGRNTFVFEPHGTFVAKTVSKKSKR